MQNRASAIWQHEHLVQGIERIIPFFERSQFKKAEKLKSRTDGTNDRANSEIEAVEFQEDPQIGRITSLRGSSGNESEGESNTTAPFLDIISGQWHKFEMPDLCAFFAGNMSRRIYVLTFSLYMYGALWSYAAVFSTSVR